MQLTRLRDRLVCGLATAAALPFADVAHAFEPLRASGAPPASALPSLLLGLAALIALAIYGRPRRDP